MTLFEEIRLHREEILALAEIYGVTDVRVFGSVARGEETADSDIDLLINVKKPIKDAFGFLDFQEKMSGLFHREVDIVFETGLYHLLRDRIINEARLI